MSMRASLISIDQGTTSSRVLLVGENSEVLCMRQKEFSQIFPKDGWVEHDPNEIWRVTLALLRDVVEHAAAIKCEIKGIGITNQRETTVIWDRRTGEPVCNAIVWQDRRTASFCAQVERDGHACLIQENSGLHVDPYFSAPKIAWILDNVGDSRKRAERGELAFGTIDTFLIWRLTGGRSHVTDVTNASRTMLFNIEALQWDKELLDIFTVPHSLLPEVKECTDDFGATDTSIVGQSIPICGVAGDQQAALVGQACFSPGMVKATYGTGAFMIANTGPELVYSDNGLLTTIGYSVNGEVSYAIEGSIFIAGAALQWLRDELGLLDDVADSAELAASLDSDHGVVFVPALTGLGSPYWRPDARGAFFGLTRATTKSHMARAALESTAYQTLEVLATMNEDGAAIERLRIDGGMSRNVWFCQFLCDIINKPVECPANAEATALGAAYLCGLHVGVFPSLESISEQWQASRTYSVEMGKQEYKMLTRRWLQAMNAVMEFMRPVE